MGKACVDITTIGGRIKNEAKKRGYKNQYIADLLHLSDGHQISPLYQNRRLFSDEQIGILANAFGLRKEYLMCIDDWETNEDMEKGVKTANISEYNIIRQYLKTIGLSLLPTVYWVCNERELYCDYWNMEEHISDNGKKYAAGVIDIPLPPHNPNFVYEHFEKAAWNYSDGNQNLFVELKSNPIKGMKNLNEMTKRDNGEDFDLYWQYTEDNIQIEILYKIIFNGETIGMLEVEQIRSFFKHIDAMCKTSIQTVLFDMISNYKFMHDIYD